jgi:regulatory protein
MPTGKITALHAQARDAQRVSLFIDGAFALGISLDTLARERLYVGQELGEEDFARLERAERVDQATRAALRLIDVRPRSAAELRDRLRRKGFEPEPIEQSVDRLVELRLVDDDAFARYWVEQRQLMHPRGPGALRDELRRKGVDPHVIAQVLDDEELVGVASEQAEQVARAALRKYAGAPDYATFARKLGGYLQRRGFAFGTIRPLLEQLWKEQGLEAPASDDGEPAGDD